MKYPILVISFLVTSWCNAQIPTNAPKPIQLPVPAIKQLKKTPDLTVEIIKVNSVSYSGNTLTVKVSFKISNSTTVSADNVMIGADVEHPDPATLEHSYFHSFNNTTTVARIAPNSSATSIFVFKRTEVPGNPDRKFRFRLEADPRYIIDEIDETNNRSAIVDINY
jgi:hypothetical protein